MPSIRHIYKESRPKAATTKYRHMINDRAVLFSSVARRSGLRKNIVLLEGDIPYTGWRSKQRHYDNIATYNHT